MTDSQNHIPEPSDPDRADTAPIAQMVLAGMAEGLIVADMAGNILDINPAALRLHEFVTAEEARRHLRQFTDTFEVRSAGGHLLPMPEWPLARALSGDTFTNYQVQVRRLDTGTVWWGTYGAALIRDEGGHPLRVVLTMQDVSALKRAEQEMRYVTGHARCLLWHGTVTQAEDGVLTWRTQVFDEAAAEAFCPLDLHPWEAYPDAWYRCRLPEDKRQTDEASRLAFASGLRHYASEFGCRDRNGVVRWFSEQVHIEVLPADPARAEPRASARWRVVGVSTDITDRRQAHRLLEESRQRYKSLFDYNADAVFSFDLEGRFQSANASCQTLSGYAPGELLQMTFLPLLVPEDRERVLRRFGLATQGRAEAFETTITHKAGHRVPLSISLMPAVVDKGVVGVYGIAKDITERHLAEQALREAVQRQRAFLRDVLASVTEGRLRLCETRPDLPTPLAPIGDPIILSSSGGLRELRHAAEEAAIRMGFPEERWQDAVTSVGEASMNAVVHAGGGWGRVCTDGRDTLQVWVEDQGQGIAVEDLPHAALQKGYTTAGTLGHGMKMMLQTADRVYLLTGGTGTTVVIEQDRIAHVFSW